MYGGFTKMYKKERTRAYLQSYSWVRRALRTGYQGKKVGKLLLTGLVGFQTQLKCRAIPSFASATSFPQNRMCGLWACHTERVGMVPR